MKKIIMSNFNDVQTKLIKYVYNIKPDYTF
jgi:hypothetical protein